MTMHPDNVTSSPRLAGRIKRYHTWPMLAEQTNADHCYHVLRIYWHVFGPPAPEVTGYVLFHDSPEMVTGDMPHPVKKHNPALAAVVGPIEDEAMTSMLGARAPDVSKKILTDIERRHVKACDLLEMLETATIETLMGNQFAVPVIQNCMVAIGGLALSDEDRELVENYIETEIGRFDR